MKAFLKPHVPTVLALAGLLGLATPALAQPGWDRGRPDSGSGGTGGYRPGPGDRDRGRPESGRGWDNGPGRGWNDNRGDRRDDRRDHDRDRRRRDYGYGYGYGPRGGYGYDYYRAPAPRYYAPRPPVYAYAPPPPPPRVVWGPAYYAPGVVIPVDAWNRRYAPDPYVFEQYARPGAVPVVIDGTLFLVDAITRTILDVITGRY